MVLLEDFEIVPSGGTLVLHCSKCCRDSTCEPPVFLLNAMAAATVHSSTCALRQRAPD
jgi:hypothetical protein